MLISYDSKAAVGDYSKISENRRVSWRLKMRKSEFASLSPTLQHNSIMDYYAEFVKIFFFLISDYETPTWVYKKLCQQYFFLIRSP